MNPELLLYLYQMLKRKQMEQADPGYKLDDLRDKQDRLEYDNSKNDQSKAKLKQEYLRTLFESNEPEPIQPRYLDPVE